MKDDSLYIVAIVAVVAVVGLVIMATGSTVVAQDSLPDMVESDSSAIAGQAFMVDMSCEGYSDEEVRVARAGCETCLAFAENVFLQCKLDAEKKHCDGDCAPAYTDAIEMCALEYSDYVHDCENSWTMDCAVCSN